MAEQRNTLYVALVAAAVIMPTVLSLARYAISKDPHLRPLGITKQALRSYETGFSGYGEVEIVAQVAWVAPSAAGFTRQHLEKAIVDAFHAKGMDVKVRFTGGTDTTRITYRVGKSVIGPFTAARASAGVQAAVEAYRMYPQD